MSVNTLMSNLDDGSPDTKSPIRERIQTVVEYFLEHQYGTPINYEYFDDLTTPKRKEKVKKVYIEEDEENVSYVDFFSRREIKNGKVTRFHTESNKQSKVNVDLQEGTYKPYQDYYYLESEIYDNFYQDEFIIGNVMEKQINLTPDLYNGLISYVLSISNRICEGRDVFCITVSCFNLYLSRTKDLDQRKIILSCFSSIIIADKIDSVFRVSPKKINYILNSQFTRKEFEDMELEICRVVEYNFIYPNPKYFFDRYFHVLETPVHPGAIMEYIYMKILFYPEMLDYKPSMIAASIAYLVNEKINKNNNWSNTMIKNSKYYLHEIIECVERIKIILKDTKETDFPYQIYRFLVFEGKSLPEYLKN